MGAAGPPDQGSGGAADPKFTPPPLARPRGFGYSHRMKCAACGYEHPGTYGQACPACGAVAQDPFQATPPPGPNPWAAPATNPVADPEPPPSYDGLPWEERKDAQSMLDTVKAVLLDTTEAFSRTDPRASLNNAFIFALILGSVGAIATQLWQMVGMAAFMKFLPSTEGLDLEALGGLGASGLVGVIMAPVSMAMGLFIHAGITHVLLMLFGGAQSGFEATFRVIAYSTGAVAPLYLVPGVGLLVGAIWGIVINIMGLAAIHNTTGLKAAAAVLLIPVLCVCCIGAGAAALIPALASLR
jgi:hypothetical protein